MRLLHVQYLREGVIGAIVAEQMPTTDVQRLALFEMMRLTQPCGCVSFL